MIVNANFHEQLDYYCMQQMSTQNIIFLEKKLVVSNILSFVRRKMLVKLAFCFVLLFMGITFVLTKYDTRYKKLQFYTTTISIGAL